MPSDVDAGDMLLTPFSAVEVDGHLPDENRTVLHEQLIPEQPRSTDALPDSSSPDDEKAETKGHIRVDSASEPLKSNTTKMKATPLDLWLDQLTTPPMLDYCTGTETKTDGENENEALECFRYVHIEKAYDELSINSEPKNTRNLREVEFNARIYYRNIRDKYPDIPEYLARRLAKANENRADRLGICRIELMSVGSSDSSEENYGEVVSNTVGSNGEMWPLSEYEGESSELMTMAELQAVKRKLMAGELPASKKQASQDIVSEMSFWSQSVRLRGPHSSASGSSNCHNSLHGSDNASDGRSRRSARTFSTGKSPGSNNTHDNTTPLLTLPPPPIELGTQKSFTCDICSHQVEVLRRRDWK